MCRVIFVNINRAKWVIYIVKCVCAERNDSDIGHAALTAGVEYDVLKRVTAD